MNRRSGQRPHSGVMGRRIIPGYTMYRTITFASVSGQINDPIYEATTLFRPKSSRIKDPGDPTGLVATSAGVLDDHQFSGESGRLRIMRRTMFEAFGLSGYSTVLGFGTTSLTSTLGHIGPIVVHSSGTIEIYTVVTRHSITDTNKIRWAKVRFRKTKTSFGKKYLSRL